MTLTLTEYITNYLGDLVTSLDVSASAISFAGDEAIEAYGGDTEADCTDLTKLHKLANVKIWERLMLLSSASFDISADGGSYKTSQIYDFCKQNYLNSINEASQYLPEFQISISQFPISGSHCHNISGSYCYAEY